MKMSEAVDCLNIDQLRDLIKYAENKLDEKCKAEMDRQDSKLILPKHLKRKN
jgi:hypothetical protein